jgi:hypothetical protein
VPISAIGHLPRPKPICRASARNSWAKARAS